MVGRATLTMVVSMIDMNMAATKTTLTATFSLTSPVVRGLPDRGRPATSARVFMTSFLGSGRGPGQPCLVSQQTDSLATLTRDTGRRLPGRQQISVPVSRYKQAACSPATAGT